jgi:hypothetical protein
MFQRLWRWCGWRLAAAPRASVGFVLCTAARLEEERKRRPRLPPPVYLGLVGFSLGLNMGHFRTRRTAPSCGEDNDLLAEILPPRPPRHRRPFPAPPSSASAGVASSPTSSASRFPLQGLPRALLHSHSGPPPLTASRAGASSRSSTTSTGGKSPAAAAALLLHRMRLQVLVWDPVAASPVT